MKLSRLLCLLSLVCVLVFSQTAPAAESAPSFNWTGPYVGLHLGYGQGDGVTTSTWVPAYVPPGFTLSPSPSGLVGGVQAGYNYQMGCFVVGIEADFSGSGMSGSSSISPYPGYPTGSGTVGTAYENINWYGTVRPRLGYTVQPNVLIYATGGLAYGDVSYSANAYGPLNGYPASVSTTKVGWALGGGVEYAVSRCWTIKAEYLYMDLGSESAIVGSIPPISPPYQVNYNWETTANIFQIGMNYKF